MSTPILAKKPYIPPPRPEIVQCPRLVTRLNEGLHHKLTLISAPAGFGKTTIVSAWLTECSQPTAWVSLDDGADRDHRHGPVLSVLQYRAPISKSGPPRTSAGLQRTIVVWCAPHNTHHIRQTFS